MTEQQKLDKFYSSLTELERSFWDVRRKLAHFDTVPAEIIDRLNTYLSICEKQRAYGTLLRKYIEGEQFEEVARCIKLINGMSVLMLEDVPDFIFALEPYSISLPGYE